jgi:hypothetical protein
MAETLVTGALRVTQALEVLEALELIALEAAHKQALIEPMAMAALAEMEAVRAALAKGI